MAEKLTIYGIKLGTIDGVTGGCSIRYRAAEKIYSYSYWSILDGFVSNMRLELRAVSIFLGVWRIILGSPVIK